MTKTHTGDAIGVRLNPPAPGQFIGLIRFRRGLIVGFACGTTTAGRFRTISWRGEPVDPTEDEVVPVGQLDAGQLAYCRAKFIDMPDYRGRFLTDYFLPPAVLPLHND